MAAPKKGRRQAAPGKPGRTLVLIMIALVALTGGMFLSGHTTPRLGIDLAGGTSITLEAKNEPGQKNAINQTNLNTAVDIINNRVNGLGVSEAEVQTQGDRNIIVNIPKGTNAKQAREQVGTTAQLYFRPVLAQQPSTGPAQQPKPKPTPSSSDKGDKPKESDKPEDKATTPSGTPTTQGRSVTDGLKDEPTPTGTPTGDAKDKGDKGKDDGKKAPTPPADPTANLQEQFTKLDCTDEKARLKVKEGVKPTDTVVACGKSGDGKGWDKFILGPSEVNGKEVDDAKAVYDTQGAAGWKVTMKFSGKGTKQFGDITGKLASKQPPQNEFGIVMDGEVVSAPYVRQALTTGDAEISGSFTQDEAKDLANILSYGALPLTFKEQSVTTVSAALGGEQLHAGLIAGAIGLALVIIYLVAYYRGLAFIAIASLGVSAALTYTIMTLLGPTIKFALNLPAVCGAIVAIGITADSFIVYFERIRDEIREGRTLRPAVERAWPRARRTILVSDFVSFLAAAVLFVVTVGKVQGFAFTLGLTTLLDVVVVFFFTKPLMTIMARKKFFAGGGKWSGLDPKRLGAKPPLRRSRAGATAAPADSTPKEA
ncbi:protein translocase subunit SecD [Streptomyces flavofungini]|uniref:Protein translocase subunit SecD n=1 Tax=Streptomyces flavofungini TaxID=68200 RepID=A0ABS0X478_9ACTN|nr:protein translocase subunit SecD [Streptomyces flavofungini]MBJ3807997.1 protein translocase subunit SecD [Streptomyces flavofungini]GHC82857.1 protein translocase subunit SecD [Streptomyces flavofungini]